MAIKERRYRVVILNEEILSILVQLPEGMRIEWVTYENLMGRLGIVVSHPSFAEVDDGGEIPTMALMVNEENGRLRMDWGMG